MKPYCEVLPNHLLVGLGLVLVNGIRMKWNWNQKQIDSSWLPSLFFFFFGGDITHTHTRGRVSSSLRCVFSFSIDLTWQWECQSWLYCCQSSGSSEFVLLSGPALRLTPASSCASVRPDVIDVCLLLYRRRIRAGRLYTAPVFVMSSISRTGWGWCHLTCQRRPRGDHQHTYSATGGEP